MNAALQEKGSPPATATAALHPHAYGVFALLTLSGGIARDARTDLIALLADWPPPRPVPVVLARLDDAPWGDTEAAIWRHTLADSGVRVLGVAAESAQAAATARALGVNVLRPLPPRTPRSAPVPAAVPAPAAMDRVLPEAAPPPPPPPRPPARPSATATATPAASTPPPHTRTALRPVLWKADRVHSGDRMEAAGDCVIDGPLASGADVWAAGSVRVLGALRGRVHAGCAGDARAWIACQDWDGEMVAIAGVFATGEDFPPELRHRPLRFSLDGATRRLRVTPLGPPPPAPSRRRR